MLLMLGTWFGAYLIEGLHGAGFQCRGVIHL
jgi:hypothetical protein